MKIYPTAKISERTKLFLHENTSIGDHTLVACDELHMEDGACINRFCEAQGRGRIYIGKYAQVASYVALVTSTDTPWGFMSDMQKDESLRRILTDDIIIEDHAFIGMHSVIMPGVTIGEGAVIGAFSYISKDVPAWVIMHPPKQKPYMVKRKIDIEGLKPRTGTGFKKYERGEEEWDYEQRQD